MARVFVVCNTAWSLYHFRLPLIRALQGAGHEVWTVSPHDDFVQRLVERGIRHIAVPMNRKGANPLEDLLLTSRYYRLLRRHRPDVVLAYRAKPNIYGTLAARRLGIPVVNTITGLGAAFLARSALAPAVEALYRLALRTSARVVFQNDDDLQHFVRRKLVNPAVAERISGSGVDTDRFAPGRPHGKGDPIGDPFVFLLVGRLLRDKGIVEYAEAARKLHDRGLPVECRVLGFFDPGNPSAISADEMEAWSEGGGIRYLGGSDAAERAMGEADCVVLPSYREGLPRTLIEAAAMGKPLITTDVPGCREVVRHGENGLLCRPRDPGDLADKMLAMFELPEQVRVQMGRTNREKACREYDERIVLRRYLELVAELGTAPGVRRTPATIPAGGD